jgi:glycosyltransferase involved in cell wall biosynthesis
MFSVVIPSLDSPIINTVVAALQAQTRPDLLHEVIVVGQDRHGLVPDDVVFLQTPCPVPAAGARNQGALAASGKYVLFIDSDCVAEPDLIERIARQHQAGRPVVGCSIAPGGDSYWMQSDHVLIFADFLPGSEPGERPFLPSGCCSVERALFLEFNGFDERFPGAAGEEVDLCLRLRERGVGLFFEPGTGVRHCHPRISASSVWNHLRRFGQIQVTLWRRHPELARPPLGGRLRPLSGLLTATAPLLALADVARLLGRRPAMRAYWHLAPGMIWARTAWYWGVVEALLATA